MELEALLAQRSRPARPPPFGGGGRGGGSGSQQDLPPMVHRTWAAGGLVTTDGYSSFTAGVGGRGPGGGGAAGGSPMGGAGSGLFRAATSPPANVLLVREPGSGALVAKVADFGLSGLCGQLGGGGADTCGTVAYSAPERLAEEGGGVEQPADVYSFGVCMQQLASGKRPFADLTYGQVVFGVLCRGLKPEWPQGQCGALEPLYEMCCDADPSKRPTFDQVLAWLDSLHFPPPAPSTSTRGL
ncbi:putative serine/threonine-protein kinase [Tetrabaena socialis]|uniref:Putative serine/threonine-protein kinase n=1 Tax=Tetrabaena socialis TaxID=47790 RepID=A0A2J8AHZ7_9CHLO|nr:putative serine/threonine-protein kinase [Tetrabaena socialis]|eukprot:PNH12153.1 putative serine/threonine-protein kinase [Tetrabaena socialis]